VHFYKEITELVRIADTLNLMKGMKTARDPEKIPVDLGFDENFNNVVGEVVKEYGQINTLDSHSSWNMCLAQIPSQCSLALTH